MISLLLNDFQTNKFYKPYGINIFTIFNMRLAATCKVHGNEYYTAVKGRGGEC